MIGHECFDLVNGFLAFGIDRQGFLDDQVRIFEGGFAQRESIKLIPTQFVLYQVLLLGFHHFEGDLLDCLHKVAFCNERTIYRLQRRSGGLGP